MNPTRTACTGMLALAFASGCTTAQNWGTATRVNTLDPRTVVFQQTGTASYYSSYFDNRVTANGETYRPEQYTAAHLTLPFGTLVMVRRRSTGRFVIVRVNDRGPYVQSRVIDLSYAAARKIGILHSGLADVDLYILPDNSRFVAQL